MAKLEQKRFAAVVRLLQTAYPNAWEKHLHNLGVTASADLSPAEAGPNYGTRVLARPPGRDQKPCRLDRV